MYLIEKILDSYKRRSSLSIGSFLFVLLGAVTAIWFQKLNVSSFKDVFAFMETNRAEMIWTFLLNFFTGLAFLGVSFLWFISMFEYRSSDHHYFGYQDYQDKLVDVIVCLITAIIAATLSYLFFSYILSKLLAFAFLVFIAVVALYNISNKK